jgi:hypothetical protein
MATSQVCAAAGVPQLTEVHHGLDAGVLDGVVGVRAGTEQADGDGAHPGEVAVEESAQRRDVTALGVEDQPCLRGVGFALTPIPLGIDHLGGSVRASVA